MSMLRLSVLSLAAAVVFAPGAEAGCRTVVGSADMVTTDLAKFMANAALKNSISGMGAKPVGPVAMTCSTGSGLPTCVAKQRACK